MPSISGRLPELERLFTYVTRGRSRPLPIYLAAGSIFAALAARNFLLPLRVHELGADKVQVGLLFAVFTVTAAGLSLPTGLLSDRFGRRSVVLFSVVTGGVSQLGLALAPNVAPLYAWQAIGGLGGAASQAALFAALADAVPGARLGRAMGWLTLSMQGGFLLGPALAGVSLQWLSLQEALGASVMLFALALVMTPLGIAAERTPAARFELRAPLQQVMRQRGFLAATAGLFGATLIWGTLQAYLPLYGTEQLRLPAAQIGYMIAIQAVVNGLARVPGGRLVDRSPRRGPLVVAGLATFAVCVAVLPHLGGFWPATLLLVASTPPVAVVFISLSVVFGNLSTQETRGVAMGIYSTVLYAGLGIGPVVFGTVLETSGYVAGFTACAVTGLLFAGLVALLRTERARRTSPLVAGGSQEA
jgi:MFS family permease